MAVYPAVYVVCTLPLASARMAAMAGRDVSLTHLVVAGAMITSNGWLDVILYALTRKILIFSDDPPPEDCGIGTFQLPWECPSRFGTFTFITADCEKGSKASSILKSMSLSRKNSKASSVDSVASTAIQIQVSSVENETGEEFVGCTAPSGSFSGPSRSIANYSRRSLKGQHREMFSGHAPSLSSEHSVRAETTVHVTNTPMDAEDLKEMKQAEKKEEDVMHSTLNEEDMNLDFETKPAGL